MSKLKFMILLVIIVKFNLCSTMDGWMARHVDGCRQVSRHLQPWLEFDLSGTTNASGNHTLSFMDV